MTLEKENKHLAIEVAELQDQISSNAPQEESRYVRDMNVDIKLFSSYGLGESVTQPAYGPIAWLNPYAIYQSGGVKIIGERGEHLTKVSVEGFIPSWLLVNEESFTPSFDKRSMYVKESCSLKLSPEEDGLEVNIFERGKAVKVIDEYDEWYYVDVFLSYDANTIYNGWLKKESLAYYDDFSSPLEIEVNAKVGNFDPQLHPEGLWGRIWKETDDLYYISSFGASSYEVKKDALEPFFHQSEE